MKGNSQESKKVYTQLSKTFILTKHCFKIESEKIKTRCFMCFFLTLLSCEL